jgi:hypothetical protein
MNIGRLLLEALPVIGPKLASKPLVVAAATVLVAEGAKVLKRRKAARAARKAG